MSIKFFEKETYIKENEIVKLHNEALADFAKKNRTIEEAQKMVLIIPKIEANSPIIIPKGTDNNQVLAALEEGVGLYPNSAIPGQDGRAVILGHSSTLRWYNGKYAYIFSLLSKLEPGDEFFVTTPSKKYTFLVYAKDFLSPDQTNETVAKPTQGSEIALITCYPIGSDSQRTLVRAKLISSEDF